jgi:hypothetical protein
MMRISYILLTFWAVFPGALYAAEGALYVAPETGVYVVGDVFDVRIVANSDGAAITAAEAELRFDPASLEVAYLSTDSSILTTWSTDPTFSNETGIVKFSGWAGEHYTGTSGQLLTITFRALRNSTSNARLAAGALLAADGLGSNIVTDLRSGVYTIAPRQTTPTPIEVVEPPIVVSAATTSDDISAIGDGSVAIIQPPQLSDYPTVLEPGERIIFKGTTEPSARVFVWIQQGDQSPEHFEVLSAANGEFTYVSEGGAEAGVYRAWLEAQQSSGAQSSPTDKITFTVRSNNIAAVAASGAEMLTVLMPLLALVITGGLAIGYLAHRYNAEQLKYAYRRDQELVDDEHDA